MEQPDSDWPAEAHAMWPIEIPRMRPCVRCCAIRIPGAETHLGPLCNQCCFELASMEQCA